MNFKSYLSYENAIIVIDQIPGPNSIKYLEKQAHLEQKKLSKMVSKFLKRSIQK